MNKVVFNKRQLKGAQLAKELFVKLVYWLLKDFKWAIHSNQIANCPVTVEDIENAQQISGKDMAALKGKAAWKKIKAVSGTEMKVQRDYLSLHMEVYLTMDIFFVAFQEVPAKINFRNCLQCHVLVE